MNDCILNYISKSLPTPCEIYDRVSQACVTWISDTQHYLYKLCSIDRIEHVAIITVASIGAAATIELPPLCFLFTTVSVLETALLIETFDYKDIKTDLQKADEVSNQNESLRQNISLYRDQIDQLLLRMRPFEERIQALNETQQDLSRAIELIVQARIENLALKEELDKKILELQTIKEGLDSSAACIASNTSRLDTSISENAQTATALTEVQQKIQQITNRLEELLQRATCEEKT
jgi:hypothetical protein